VATPALRPLPQAAFFDAHKPAYLLVTPEDMHPESVFGAPAKIIGAGILVDPEALWGDNARAFVTATTNDVTERVGNAFKCPTNLLGNLDAAVLIAQARAAGAEQIVTSYAPTGPIADALCRIAPILAAEGVPLVQVRRAWDENFWPHATKGFFPFKENIPKILKQMGLSR
jgi:deoxyribodipyrimidine photo-lyase